MDKTHERIDEILKSLMSTEEDIEKTASEEEQPEEVDVESLASEMEKLASEIDDEFAESTAIDGEVTLESVSLARQRLKEIIVQGIDADDPSPEFEALKSILSSKGQTKEASADLVDAFADRLIELSRG